MQRKGRSQFLRRKPVFSLSLFPPCLFPLCFHVGYASVEPDFLFATNITRWAFFMPLKAKREHERLHNILCRDALHICFQFLCHYLEGCHEHPHSSLMLTSLIIHSVSSYFPPHFFPVFSYHNLLCKKFFKYTWYHFSMKICKLLKFSISYHSIFSLRLQEERADFLVCMWRSNGEWWKGGRLPREAGLRQWWQQQHFKASSTVPPAVNRQCLS